METNETVNTLASQLTRNEKKMLRLNEQISVAVADLQQQYQTAQKRNVELRQAIKQAMEENNVTKFENDLLKITYRKPTERKGMDMERLKTERPDVYMEYLKHTPVASSITIKVKR